VCDRRVGEGGRKRGRRSSGETMSGISVVSRLMEDSVKREGRVNTDEKEEEGLNSVALLIIEGTKGVIG
jgi:hypothetical protein